MAAPAQPIIPNPAPPGSTIEDMDLTPYTEPTTSRPAETPSPPSAFAGLTTFYTDANTWLRGLREEASRGLTTALSGGPARQAQQGPLGTMGAQLGGQMLNPVPGSLPQAALILAQPAIALGPGGVLRKTALSAGASALAGSAEGGLPGAITGAAGGTVFGAAGALVNQLAQPNRLTRSLVGTSKAIREYGSLAVGNATPSDPLLLTHPKTLLSMRRASSSEIQSVVDEVMRLAPNNQITVPGLSVPTAVKHKLPLTQSPMSGITSPMGTFQELDKVRIALRSAGDPEWRHIEEAMVQAANALGSQALGKQFKSTLAQYRIDQRMIDFVEAIQAARNLPGGVSPTEFPALQSPAKGIFGEGSLHDPASMAYHLARGTALTAAGATGWGAVHLGTAASQILRGHKVPVASQAIKMPGLGQKLFGKIGAATISEIPATTRLRDVMPQPAPPSREEETQ